MAAARSKDTWTDDVRPSLFRSPPRAVKSLRRKYKDHLSSPGADALLKEMTDESDRATIILTTQLLDDALTIAIARHLSFAPKLDEMERIFRFEGPLGSFSHKIEVAFLFGIIEDGTLQQLNLFRELRNACAHCTHLLTFSDPSVMAVTQRLFQPLGYSPQPERSPGHIKLTFIKEAIFVHGAIILDSREKAAESLSAALPPSVGISTSVSLAKSLPARGS